jgi:hypothetical protein
MASSEQTNCTSFKYTYSKQCGFSVGVINIQNLLNMLDGWGTCPYPFGSSPTPSIQPHSTPVFTGVLSASNKGPERCRVAGLVHSWMMAGRICRSYSGWWANFVHFL